MKLKQHDKLKDINKETISWDDYYEEVKPLLGLRETGFTKTFEYLRRIKEPVIVETGTVRVEYKQTQ